MRHILCKCIMIWEFSIDIEGYLIPLSLNIRLSSIGNSKYVGDCICSHCSLTKTPLPNASSVCTTLVSKQNDVTDQYDPRALCEGSGF